MTARLTVAVCTWNRAELLRGTLERMRTLDVPDALDWELLVVDNGCTDATPSVLRALADALPLRVVTEPLPGHSHARNRALDEARGDWIVWTDDDVLVAPGWLGAYARAFDEHADVAFFGGPITARFAAPPPAWLQAVWPEVETLYAVRAVPAGALEIEPEHLPFGANYAVRADVQRRFPYDAELGHRRGRPVGMEELVCMTAILDDGGRGRWVPDAAVEHVVGADRLNDRWVIRTLAAQAALEVDAIPVEGRASAFGAPLWLWKKWLEAEAVYRTRRSWVDPEHRLRYLRDVGLRRGQLDAIRRRSRGGASA